MRSQNDADLVTDAWLSEDASIPFFTHRNRLHGAARSALRRACSHSHATNLVMPHTAFTREEHGSLAA